MLHRFGAQHNWSESQVLSQHAWGAISSGYYTLVLWFVSLETPWALWKERKYAVDFVYISFQLKEFHCLRILWSVSSIKRSIVSSQIVSKTGLEGEKNPNLNFIWCEETAVWTETGGRTDCENINEKLCVLFDGFLFRRWFYRFSKGKLIICGELMFECDVMKV